MDSCIRLRTLQFNEKGNTWNKVRYRDSAWVVVAVSGKVTCPVNMMNQNLDKAQHSHNSPLFRQLRLNLAIIKLVFRGLSYTRLRELVIEVFRGIVPDILHIETHSLRSGRATAAASASVPDRPFLCHSRWSSGSTKDGCVEDSLSVFPFVGF